MGRDWTELQAVTTLSRHNSPQDDKDNAAWNQFVADVRRVAEASGLGIEVMADGDMPVDQWGDDDE